MSPVVLKRSDLISPVITDEKIEGEKMILEKASGGNFRYQNSERFGWSDNMQVFWSDTEVGDKLTLQFVSEKAGESNVSAQITTGPDYGEVQMSINGRNAANLVDAYAEEVNVIRVDLGKFKIQKGKTRSRSV